MSGLAWPVAWTAACGLLSWAAVGGMLRLARRRGMLDLPGRRRSHLHPTPRGGGIGMMLVLLLLLPWIGLNLRESLAIGISLGLVAAIGAWDDLAPRGVGQRLLVQALAVACAAGVLLSGHSCSPAWLWLLLPLGMWSINLHNFMDGIDGLLAGHTLLISAALAVLAMHLGWPALATLAAMLAAASAGFLCFNWAPARIFMGDAGSGGCGLLLFVISLALVVRQPGLLGAVVVLASGFVVDASLTLGYRMIRGRRWTRPHREHLYQWLVRSGHGHAGVSLAYLGWDAAVVGWLFWRGPDRAVGPLSCVLVYLLASGLWLGYKSGCLRRRRAREVK